MPASALRSFQLIDAQTVTVTNQSSQIYGITIACQVAGQHIRVVDKGSPAKMLVPPYAPELERTDAAKPENPRILEWTNGKVMEGGIAIISAGTGTTSVWIDYQSAPLGST